MSKETKKELNAKIEHNERLLWEVLNVTLENCSEKLDIKYIFFMIKESCFEDIDFKDRDMFSEEDEKQFKNIITQIYTFYKEKKDIIDNKLFNLERSNQNKEINIRNNA